jgi:hypothetical protein
VVLHCVFLDRQARIAPAPPSLARAADATNEGGSGSTGDPGRDLPPLCAH